MLLDKVVDWISIKIFENGKYEKNTARRDFWLAFFVAGILGVIVFTAIKVVIIPQDLDSMDLAFVSLGIVFSLMALGIFFAYVFSGWTRKGKAILLAITIAGLLLGVALPIFVQNLSENFHFVWIILIAVLITGELIFLKFDKQKPEKSESRFWFTAKRKVVALLEATFVVVESFSLILLSTKAWPFIQENQSAIKEFLGYFGIIVLILGIIAGYVFVNSLKYGNGETESKKKVKKKRRSK